MTTPDLNSAIVRILINDQEPRQHIGAGFLVSDKHVLTCAHVIADTIGIPRNTMQMPSQSVVADFPMLPQKPKITAKIIAWYPLKENASIDESEDIAVLELITHLPNDAQPVPLLMLKPHLQNDRKVKLFGFPQSQDEGYPLDGELKGLIGSGKTHINTSQGNVAPGFSGSAVWDKLEHAVVGMIASISEYQGNIPAYMIPVSTLTKAIPESIRSELVIENLKPKLLRWFFIISLMLVMLSSGMFWGYQRRMIKTNGDTVEELGNKAVELWGHFQSIENKVIGTQKKDEVREKAPKLVQELMALSDKHMDRLDIIMKYHVAAFSLSMAASTETNKSEKKEFADQAIEAAEKTLCLIKKLEDQSKTGDKDANEFHKWLVSNNKKELIHFVLAVCYAIKAQHGDQVAYEEVEKHLNKIPCIYQKENPPKMDPDLNWYLESIRQKNSGSNLKICTEEIN